MKKRIHILSVRDHRKLIVEPDEHWYEDVRSTKYWERFRPRHIGGDAPRTTRYSVGVDDHYTAVAYFVSFEAAHEWLDEQNARHPPPPKPAPPPPPFPIGTYYMLDAGYYEIRQITRRQYYEQIVGHEKWKRPYLLARGDSGWQEKFLAKFDARDEALAHLHKLIQRARKKKK